MSVSHEAFVVDIVYHHQGSEDHVACNIAACHGGYPEIFVYGRTEKSENLTHIARIVEIRPGNHHFGIDRGYYFMWAYCLSVPHLVTYIVFFRPGKTVTAQAGCSVIRQQVERRSGFGEGFQLLDTPWAV